MIDLKIDDCLIGTFAVPTFDCRYLKDRGIGKEKSLKTICFEAFLYTRRDSNPEPSDP